MKNLNLALLAASTRALNMGHEPHIEINMVGFDDMDDMDGDNIQINIEMDDCDEEATAGDAATAGNAATAGDTAIDMTYDDFDDVYEEAYDSPFSDYESQVAVTEQIYDDKLLGEYIASDDNETNL